MIAENIVEAAKAGNQAKVDKLQKDWHRNADDIAKFLSAANPNRSFEALQEILYTHLQLITDIVVNCLEGKDFLTEGIVKPFPEKF